eukprot:TRINITY_DN1792_c0_g1_i3.p1 TRINITY_DN1792_c0_g1~~TRINITY_DN1792_c0_g1_i3.p1  ORF type:complete len:278 (-),score=40.07 TRINITY_DN1792_c0_g1_i3:64-897(-)
MKTRTESEEKKALGNSYSNSSGTDICCVPFAKNNNCGTTDVGQGKCVSSSSSCSGTTWPTTFCGSNKCCIEMSGTLGVDISELGSVNFFQCLKASGFEYVIIRASRSLGIVDHNAVPSILNALSAGFSDIDVYIFPDSRQNATKQMYNMVDYLNQDGVRYGRIWLDIEGRDTKYWSADKQTNRAFITELVNAGKSLGKDLAFYASKASWDFIVGSDFTPYGNMDLWYARYDWTQNFDDWSPYGGWTKPFMKQWSDSRSLPGLCGGPTPDLNWRPHNY